MQGMRGSWRRGVRVLGSLAALLLASSRASAQQLEPRAYSPNPTGTNFTGLGYTYQTGGIVFDASLPFSDVTANINIGTISYVRTFALFGRSASAGVVAPYAWGHIQGKVFEEQRQIYRSGLADLLTRMTVNLIGGPAMTLGEFAASKPTTTLGLSLFVVAPTGQYNPAKLINIGANRWGFKPELGFSHPTGHWVFEVYGGAWFYTTNGDFYGGQTRSQSPVGTVQAHVSYNFRPRLWVAADYTYYWGGESTLDGVAKGDRLNNSRIGLTAAVPVARNQSIKFAWSKGAATPRIGTDFSTYAIAYQFLWFDRK